MSPTRQKKGLKNIPVRTAIHVSFAAMTAAVYASAKNPVTVKNQRKLNSVCLIPNSYPWIIHLT
jgi:hypothetical protein